MFTKHTTSPLTSVSLSTPVFYSILFCTYRSGRLPQFSPIWSQQSMRSQVINCHLIILNALLYVPASSIAKLPCNVDMRIIVIHYTSLITIYYYYYYYSHIFPDSRAQSLITYLVISNRLHHCFVLNLFFIQRLPFND